VHDRVELTRLIEFAWPATKRRMSS